ncbi:hypothetical protein KR018_001105 [Drosophila ironensis]|nr:hypothetical protein KR018_001105 [Drosophila ironensis]
MMFPQHINTPVGSYAFVCTTTNKFTGGFEFHMFNTQTHVTYKEKLKPQAFMERLMEVNANDQFNEYAVRKALVVGKATYSDMVLREIGGIEVITLKYEIDGSPMPLEWKWKVDFDHMGPLFNNGVVATAGMYKEILGQIDYLLDVIKSKDEELEQFRGNSVLCMIFY